MKAMESESERSDNLDQGEVKPNVWTTVTPVSKYLAMALFVALPFIGGWIGYQYAPERIVEIERMVVEDTDFAGSSENDTTASKIDDGNTYEGCVYLADAILKNKESDIEQRYDAGEFRGGTASGLYQAATAEHEEQIEICNNTVSSNTEQVHKGLDEGDQQVVAEGTDAPCQESDDYAVYINDLYSFCITYPKTIMREVGLVVDGDKERVTEEKVISVEESEGKVVLIEPDSDSYFGSITVESNVDSVTLSELRDYYTHPPYGRTEDSMLVDGKEAFIFVQEQGISTTVVVTSDYIYRLGSIEHYSFHFLSG